LTATLAEPVAAGGDEIISLVGKVRVNKRLMIQSGLALTALGAASAASAAASFPDRILAAHNLVRAQTGLPGLMWDPALAAAAASYARRLAVTGAFQHSDRSARRGVGENLWMGTRGAFSVENMVGSWASERRMFAPGIFPAVSRTGNWADVGHYTQMIWPTTRRVGCAIASNARADYLVCRYWPAGNINGRPVTGSRFTTAFNRRY
jgi:hypothetical protein